MNPSIQPLHSLSRSLQETQSPLLDEREREMDCNFTVWYSQPLSEEDLFAGLSLFLIGTIGISFYLIIAYILLKNSNELVGFRCLLSEAIVGSLALLEYGTWAGLTILFKSTILPHHTRYLVQAYIDWVWFGMCYHYTVIAWSRLCAIRFPIFFRLQTKLLSYLICGLCYIIALIQTIISQQLSFYVLFYYEPSAYGFVAEDFDKYRSHGHAKYMSAFNITALICPLLLYTFTIYYIVIQKYGAQGKSGPTTNSNHPNLKIEINLMVPCIMNTIVFLIGQIMLTVGWEAGKWFGWSILVLFCVQALANPILLLIFSSAVRQKTATFLRISKVSHKKLSAASNMGASGRPAYSGDTVERRSSVIDSHKISFLSNSNISVIPVD